MAVDIVLPHTTAQSVGLLPVWSGLLEANGKRPANRVRVSPLAGSVGIENEEVGRSDALVHKVRRVDLEQGSCNGACENNPITEVVAGTASTPICPSSCFPCCRGPVSTTHQAPNTILAPSLGISRY